MMYYDVYDMAIWRCILLICCDVLRNFYAFCLSFIENMTSIS